MIHPGAQQLLERPVGRAIGKGRLCVLRRVSQEYPTCQAICCQDINPMFTLSGTLNYIQGLHESFQFCSLLLCQKDL